MLLFAVGYGIAHPLLPDEFPTIGDARQWFLHIVLFTRTTNCAAEIITRLQMAYPFNSAFVKPMKDFDATLKRCADHVHFIVLLPSLSFTSLTGLTRTVSYTTRLGRFRRC